MQLISTNDISDSDIISNHIFSSNGSKILSAGVSVSELLKQRLLEMGIKAVFIQTPGYEDIIFKEPVNYNTRAKAISIYKKIEDSVINNRELDESAIKEVTAEIVDDIRATGVPAGIFNMIYVKEEPRIMHAINTAEISVAIAMNLNYNFNQLCDIAIAGFCHDIGQVFDNEDDKPEHAKQGFEALRKCRTVNLKSSIVSFEHHENYDGTGFPRGLKGENISDFSRIISVADYYDGLVNMRKRVYNPEKAYEDILENSDKKFDPQVVNAFKKAIQVYLTGMEVLLNDGRKGVVIRQNSGHPLRPVVRLKLSDESFEELDLLENIQIKIEKALL